MKDATPEKIESILAAEVLKLPFIRQVKTDRLYAFAIGLIITVAVFIGLMSVAPKTISDKPPAISSQSQLPAFRLVIRTSTISLLGVMLGVDRVEPNLPAKPQGK